MTSSNILDNPKRYLEIDPSGMGARIENLPTQCKQAWETGRQFVLPSGYELVDRVLVVGMGGSATGGDLLSDLASLEPCLPLTVVRDCILPDYVDNRTLVIATSNSGNTQETLAAFKTAVARKARVVGITGGGKMAQYCREMNIPVFTVNYKSEPRLAWGYSLLVPLALLCSLNLISPKNTDVEEAIALLQCHQEDWKSDVRLVKNAAKALAHKLHGHTVVLYGSSILQGVARGWKTRINENAKTWAFYDLIPELNHNSAEGYVYPEKQAKETVVALLKPSSPDNARDLQYQLATATLRKAGVPHHIITPQGRSLLAQAISCLYLGDFTSYYMAILNGVDPSPVQVISDLKAAQPSSY